VSLRGISCLFFLVELFLLQKEKGQFEPSTSGLVRCFSWLYFPRFSFLERKALGRHRSIHFSNPSQKLLLVKLFLQEKVVAELRAHNISKKYYST